MANWIPSDLNAAADNFTHLFAVGTTDTTPSHQIMFYQSADGGSTWTTSLLANANSYGDTLVVDPTNENVIYIGGYKASSSIGAVFKSINRGISWTEVSSGLGNVHVKALSIQASNPSRIYAGTSDGLYRSDNGGTFWTKASHYPATSIAVNKNNPAEIYIGGSLGIYSSLDWGATWLDYNDGLTDRDVTCLAYDSVNDVLYAGTSGGGVFRNRILNLATLSLTCSPGGSTVPESGELCYLVGASVQITAKANAGYRFIGWSGDASGIANPITAVMDANKSVRANFEAVIKAPLDFAGVKKANRSLVQIEHIIRLTWRSNPANVSIVKHSLYLMEGGTATLLAEIPTGTSVYVHRRVEKDKEYTYRLAAVNAEGWEGPPAQVTVK